ncbi:MauE/DoxX family redox-associated membrane protein [Pedobacter nyackensis]|uniref:Methylamine utilisation protein MauE n=1 Tax=Pedobacter nyackensis TaxID=475255 RepID=A0A1W2CZI5_9SPHI|nr:MauE/DoxX family redox-associated membrane protein [Pedobacter nyackensis]SMC90254.1 Methylamine utilisation protein MauE [Pedobacter nyackensis]
METTLNKQTAFRLSAKTREIIIDIIAYSFIILFMYTAADKLLTIKSFASTLAKSPLIGSYHMIIAWAIPIIEIIISIILIIPSVRKAGLQASLLLISAFTLYLIYMVLSGSKLPCHCGGVISAMTWQQHIWFNLAFVTLAIFGLTIIRKEEIYQQLKLINFT